MEDPPVPVEALVSVPPLPIGDLSVTDDNDQQNVMSEPVAAAGVEEPSSGNADQAGTEIPRGDMASILSPEGTFMGDKTAPIEGSSPKKSIRALSGDGSPEPYDSEEARQYMEESAASRAKNAERCLHSDVLSGPDHNFYDKSVPIEGSTPRKPLVRSSSPQPFDKSVTQQVPSPHCARAAPSVVLTQHVTLPESRGICGQSHEECTAEPEL
eukprot:3941497-Rhodomonas_salina.2